jgi:hypothetical protein
VSLQFMAKWAPVVDVSNPNILSTIRCAQLDDRHVSLVSCTPRRMNKTLSTALLPRRAIRRLRRA